MKKIIAILLSVFFLTPACFAQDVISVGGVYNFSIMNVLDGEDSFNRFMTIVLIFGLFAITSAVITRLICKS